jgi:hypothetical protein
MAKKELPKICKYCKLYDTVNQHCKVVVLFDGKRMHPPTEPETFCIFEDQYESIDEKGNKDTWKPEIQEVKWWVEDPSTGEKTDNGIVKIEYPVGFFGETEKE